jgi:hypothetical protein
LTKQSHVNNLPAMKTKTAKRQGRPAYDPARRRSRVVGVPLTPAAHARLLAAAKGAGVSAGEVCRRALAGWGIV